MKHWALIACFAILGFVTAACNKASATNATDIPTTPPMTQTPQVTTTPVRSITAKISPTIAETLSLLVEATPTFQPEILAEVATLDAIVSEKPELKEFYDRLCITGICGDSDLGLSPNKKWAVFFTTEKGTGGLSIVNVDTKYLWTISYHDITGFDSEYGCDCTVAIEHWSHDGHYLYVSPQVATSGGEGWFWRSAIQLIRINLDNGTWVNTKMGSSFSFSPNDKFIAYRREENLVIHEFQTGNERRYTIPTDCTVLGRFTWSSDSKQIILVCSSTDEPLVDDLPEKPSGFTLLLLKAEDMQVQTILDKDERYLYPIEWLTPNSVLLESLYEATPDGNLEYSNEQYKLDLGTNSISKYESP